jgi:EAL domain-containing protein (putative c-di-GMP-specific phosphodiesterase class I)
MGVKISIDDFGTGFSSLPYLKRLPIDTIKIDSSFVNDINTNPENAAIVMAVLAMAQCLKIRVVAEGVETKEQMRSLRHIKCDGMQGYLFGRPMPGKAFAKLLAKGSYKPLATKERDQGNLL